MKARPNRRKARLVVIILVASLVVAAAVLSIDLLRAEGSCVQTGPSQVILVEIVGDSSRSPITGAAVSGSFQISCGGNPDAKFPISPVTTSSNGTVALSVGHSGLATCECSIGNYTVSIRYSGKTVSLTVDPPTEHLD